MSLEGTFKARAATEPEWGYSSKNDFQVGVKLEIREGEHAGKRIPWRGTFSSTKAKELAIKALRTMGWTGDDVSEIRLAHLCEEVEIVTEVNDNGYVNVKWINSLGGGSLFREGSQAAPADVAAFASQLKGELAALEGSAPPDDFDQRPPPPSDDDFYGPDNDIPWS